MRISTSSNVFFVSFASLEEEFPPESPEPELPEPLEPEEVEPTDLVFTLDLVAPLEVPFDKAVPSA